MGGAPAAAAPESTGLRWSKANKGNLYLISHKRQSTMFEADFDTVHPSWHSESPESMMEQPLFLGARQVHLEICSVLSFICRNDLHARWEPYVQPTSFRQDK
jgi:hypothetical protein